MGARPRPTPTPLPHNGCFGFCRGQLRRVRLRDRPAPRWALTACEAGTQNVAVATGSGCGGRLLSPVSTASNLPGHGRHHLAIQCSSLLCVQLPPARSCLPPPPAALPNRHLQSRHPPPPAAPMHPPKHPRCHPSAVALDVPRDHVAGLVERSGRHDDKKTSTGTASPPLIPLPPKDITHEGAACRLVTCCREATVSTLRALGDTHAFLAALQPLTSAPLPSRSCICRCTAPQLQMHRFAPPSCRPSHPSPKRLALPIVFAVVPDVPVAALILTTMAADTTRTAFLPPTFVAARLPATIRGRLRGHPPYAHPHPHAHHRRL